MTAEHTSTPAPAARHVALDDKIREEVRRAFETSRISDMWSPRNTVLAAMVAVDHRIVLDDKAESPKVVVMSIGAGTRSVGRHDDSSEDPTLVALRRLITLDDGHAEVLARRGLIASVVHDMTASALDGRDGLKRWSPLERSDDGRRFSWAAGVDVHLVVTQAPCGAMCVVPSQPLRSTGAHVLLSTPRDDAAVKSSTLRPSVEAAQRKVIWHMGHALSTVMDEGLHTLRLVSRTKPGAGVPSLSMSCSDKILRWLSQGLQGGALAGCGIWAGKIPLSHIHIGRPQHSDETDAWVADATESTIRAIVERLSMSREAAVALVTWFGAESLCVAPSSVDDVKADAGVMSVAVWAGYVASSCTHKRQRDADVDHLPSTNPGVWTWCGRGEINTKDGSLFGMTRTAMSKRLLHFTSTAGSTALKRDLICCLFGADDGGEGGAVAAASRRLETSCAVSEGQQPCLLLRWAIGIRLMSLRRKFLKDLTLQTDTNVEAISLHPYYLFKRVHYATTSWHPVVVRWVEKHSLGIAASSKVIP